MVSTRMRVNHTMDEKDGIRGLHSMCKMTVDPRRMNYGSSCQDASEGRERPLLALQSNTQKGQKRLPTNFVVGDARANLDDIKFALMSYYGRVYSNSSRTIAERVDALSSTLPERCDTLAKKVSYGLPRDTSDLGGLKRQMDGSRSPLPLYEGRAAELNAALTDLHRSCEAATYKLNALSGVFYPQIENPSLREWMYTTTPQVRSRPRTNSQGELRKHATSVFRHLRTQAELNQERINALQSKIKILYMHTKPQMLKLQEDPRVGL